MTGGKWRGAWTRPAALAAVLWAFGPGAAEAQINSENFAQLGFNFSPPGARSAGLGGAFIALADDATAAETNPAGLTVLLYPGVSFEFKGIEYWRSVSREAGGGVDGLDFADSVAVPSFASVVLPIKSLTVAAFRHELVNYESRLIANGFAYPDGGYLFPYQASFSMRIENLGGALALKLGPYVSLGVAAGVSRLDMDMDFQRYRVANFTPGLLANRLRVEGEDGEGSSTFVNAGVLIRFSERLSLGGVFKRRPEFEELAFRWEDAQGNDLTTDFAVDNCREARRDDCTPFFTLRVPDSYGVGLAFRPHDQLTLSTAAVLNRYAQLPRQQKIAVAVSDTALHSEDYVADDGLDLHYGGELVVFLGQTPLALRAGVSLLAPSNTYYTGSRRSQRSLWGTAPLDPTVQYSAGVGTVFLRHLQFDAAVVVGEDRKEAVASVVIF